MSTDATKVTEETHAFPCYVPEYSDKFGVGGMTLRDYFAAKVLGGQSQWRSMSSVETQQELASLCYSMADEMIKARNIGS